MDNIEKQLQDLGVQTRNNNDEMRTIVEIFIDLQNIWQEMDYDNRKDTVRNILGE